ncbi:cysteine hydrolase [Actinacidiphila acidipaludis]|uniref:Cysteine hydrolase n=1 Tax=Actinacidiphila acidipaludis TaxID=2873382 RepID=A0ABS7QIA0_9ACTN|nr:cysteine hydrolase [Streptomyces acidipaludis]MBY8882882.1 cysteine hydrolase [Streptomyces acidipaludis]
MDERNGLSVPRSLREACDDPRRIALLVYDMQVGVVGQIGDGDQVVGQVVSTVEAARATGIRTFFLRHITLPAGLMGASQLRMWRAWQAADRAADVVSAFPPDAPQTQLVPRLRPTEHEVVIDKITMSAFEGTWLDIALRDCGITTVAVVGCALEIGVEPTVRHAADLGYVPVLVTDACGAGNKEAAERSLESLRFAGDALLTTVDEFRSVLGEAAGITS